jgi:hypothetical protein
VLSVFGAIVVCVVIGEAIFRHVTHEWKAIKGKWVEVSMNPHTPAYEWYFSDNQLDRTARGRSSYSINPILHTIEWGHDWDRATGKYELNGNELKIWVGGDKSKTPYVLKRP